MQERAEFQESRVDANFQATFLVEGLVMADAGAVTPLTLVVIVPGLGKSRAGPLMDRMQEIDSNYLVKVHEHGLKWWSFGRTGGQGQVDHYEPDRRYPRADHSRHSCRSYCARGPRRCFSTHPAGSVA